MHARALPPRAPACQCRHAPPARAARSCHARAPCPGAATARRPRARPLRLWRVPRRASWSTAPAGFALRTACRVRRDVLPDLAARCSTPPPPIRRPAATLRGAVVPPLASRARRGVFVRGGAGDEPRTARSRSRRPGTASTPPAMRSTSRSARRPNCPDVGGVHGGDAAPTAGWSPTRRASASNRASPPATSRA